MWIVLRFSIAFSFLFLMLFPLHAQPSFCGAYNMPCWSTAGRPTNPGAGIFGWNRDTLSLEAFDGTRWSSLNGSTFNVLSFGAKCDSTTDDTAAINAASAAVAAFVPIANAKPLELRFPSDRFCAFDGSLNFTGNALADTGWVRSGMVVNGTGASLICRVASGPCIDALGSRFVQWLNINMTTSVFPPPTYGIQIARVNAGGCDGQIFVNTNIIAIFSIAPLYVGACEVSKIDNPLLVNLYTGAGPGGQAAIFDGFNHWNITSAFIVNTNPVDTVRSFNDLIVTGGYLGGTSATIPTIWIGGAGGLRLDQSYSYTSSPCNMDLFYLFNDYFANNDRLSFDAHFEASSAYLACLIGTAANPIIRGFRFAQDHAFQAPTAIFHIDPASSITSISAFDLDLQYTNAPSVTNAQPVFAEPTLWSNVTGYLKLPGTTAWIGSEPNAFTGTVCFQAPAYNPTAAQITAAKCFLSTPTPAINRNPEFEIDQVNEGTTNTPAGGGVTTVIDGWIAALNGADVLSKIIYQKVVDSPVGSVNKNSFKATQNGVLVTPAAGSRNVILSVIEGSDFNQFNFGTAAGSSLNFDFCAKANNAGTYTAFMTNATQARSYVLNYVISVANTWGCFHNIIPADTAGVWASTPGTVGAYIGFGIAAGSNFNTTAGSWQAGAFNNTATTFNFLNTAGATLNITNVHIYPGPFRMPYKTRSLQQELDLALRFYQKSFSQGVAPAQGVAPFGAASFVAPYASATSATVATLIRFSTPMFSSTPTLTFYSTGAATANCRDNTAGADIGAASADRTNNNGFMLHCAAGGGFALGNTIEVHWTADSKN